VIKDELFELSLLGGRIEKRWRQLRPNVDAMPWKALDPARLTPEIIKDGRSFWTNAALAEYRAAASSAAVQRALIEARAPLDLIATGGGFVLDEVAHTELCARVANQLGGGVALRFEPARLVPAIDESLSSLGRAAQLILAVNCVSETFLLAMQRHNKKEQRNQLVRAVLASITRDEAAHARFGWLFFEWAGPLISDDERKILRQRAATAIAAHLPKPSTANEDAETLGWMSQQQYREVATSVMEQAVCVPLRERGLLD
jgi:hypothetical protein